MLTSQQINALAIVNFPDPVLRASCTPIDSFGEWTEALAQRMIELMRQAPGVGLAAPQVGLPLRLFVVNVAGEEGPARVFINPKLSNLSGREQADEGCLSLPKVDVPIDRATRATIGARDASGQPFQVTAEGLLARIWQHENDHLDGRLIIDYMDTQAELVNRRAIKTLKNDYKALNRVRR